MRRRVVITGIGVISSIGTGKEAFIEGLKKGKDGVKQIPYFDTSEYKVNRAAIVEGFDKKEYVMRDEKVEKERANVYALYGAKEAVEDSRLVLAGYDSDRLGVSLATSLASIDGKDQFNTYFLSSGYEGIDEKLVFETCSTMSGCVAKEYGIQGPSVTISTACAAGTNSVGYAFDMIQNDVCDAVITGGVDPFSRLSYSGFLSLMTITSDKISPFDENRSGIDIGEGAAVMIVEALETALKRGAHIYAEILGYGISNDAYHATSPDPNAGGAIRSMSECIKQAGIGIEDVNYINAHGTGTKVNDPMELLAIKSVFGDKAKNIPISSSKSMFGHTLGCAGSIEIMVCALAIENNFLPPTINTINPITDYNNYDFSLGTTREYKINAAISNSFAFAGNTASICVGRYTC